MENDPWTAIVAFCVEIPVCSAEEKDDQDYNTIIIYYILAFLVLHLLVSLRWNHTLGYREDLLIVLADTGRIGGKKKKTIAAKITTITQMFTSQPIHPWRRKVRSRGKKCSDLWR